MIFRGSLSYLLSLGSVFGFGYGVGFGDGSGYGSGFGSGYGYGYGYGDGDGCVGNENWAKAGCEVMEGEVNGKE